MAAITSSRLRVESSHGGAMLCVTLDAAPANVLDADMIDAITAAVRDADHRVMAIVFDHAGKHFSFGASVPEHTAEEAPGMLARFHALFRLLAEKAIPTAAIVRGRCLGGGLELASYCTWLVASPDAKLGQPEIKLAVFPPMASLVLPWRLGAGRAMDLCVSGRTVGAQEAKEMGLVTAVSDDPRRWFEDFFDTHLKAGSAIALRMAERAVRAPLTDALETRLPALERLYIDELMSTHDANEGIRAFIAKEKPVYEHR